ncbi:hypothetical protein STSP2_00519 [Anaerohalosphaera lusitana]|uniref:Uncharacterized protein n=1 Tax=Anaerohalosphaera lusitana TaxID=1936003 RepID=A0A1U9NHU2_9BACT|nr:hypothetical protein [Anaerohalosphaera lusitana]AQT67375.1 hypothetical protein STSP2_00519 [Anaerohalosphaera lusitana]
MVPWGGLENWLNVTVHCGENGASVRVSGDIIHSTELMTFLVGIERLSKTVKGQVEMACMEPYLSVVLKAGDCGHIEIQVDITPDPAKQKHSFIFEIDQSYLPKLITDCKKVLEEYPMIGKP